MKVRWLWFLPVVAWSGVIVAFSSQNATESAGASAVYAEWIVRTVHWATGWPAWAPSAPGYPDLLHAVHAAFREAMHAVEYAVLGGLLALGLRRGGPLAWTADARALRRTLLWAFVGCLLFALSDEIHQLGSPGRDFQLLDLSLDAIGSAAGLAWVGAARRKGTA